MTDEPFGGRVAELQLLNELCQASTANLLSLYGRRRVGKTKLITHWL